MPKATASARRLGRVGGGRWESNRILVAAARVLLALRRRRSIAATRERLAVGSTDEITRHICRGRRLGSHRRAPLTTIAHCATGTPASVHARRRADGHWLAQAGDPASRDRAVRAHSPSARGDPRARARAHSSSRLSRQPAADALSKRCSSIIRRSGGSRGGSAPSARTAVTTLPSASVAILLRMRGLLLIWRAYEIQLADL